MASGRSLKVAASLGTAVACGISGAVVATGTKPPSAPLRPPVDPRAPLSRPAPAVPALRIPPTALCGTVATPSMPATTAFGSLDPAVRQAATTLLAAQPAERRALLRRFLAQLTPDQRQRLTALVAMAGGHRLPSRCAASAPPSPLPPAPVIAPTVTTAPADSQPVVVSAVS